MTEAAFPEPQAPPQALPKPDSSGQTAVAGDDDEQYFFDGTLDGEFHPQVAFGVADDIAEQFLEFLGVGAHLKDGILGAAKFCCADHFHGFCDLLCVLDGFDPIAYLF